ncbi:MAG: hypothetical protein G01um101418_371 [Parcubacteria group bacterium Gr01-1014_18]|nr:MAG: hypothetical protein Greene041636_383 [Parcubacteria group bacterium Greene0416_36]TSC81092.1 MAG: hypothetical protein G01um101418_371 [Parcubacteria group bacterium Gr01-1014_18]TSC98492.1 MAG: hypothetical protein Greene101420_729 [Parcubacteria group bacterium Greene1014_20]TSD07343.1 MAG: hypothetical protein Greene07142_198 [Parcubacteria group bacterium Greene0714_2]
MKIKNNYLSNKLKEPYLYSKTKKADNNSRSPPE